MKTRLVIWGQDAQDAKVLLAIKLQEKENKVDMYSFPEEVATEAFYTELMDKWRNGEDIDFPENHQHQERPLTVSEGILPDDVKVERTDLVLRAQTEWHFIVLSTKLHESYREELDAIKEKINRLNEFENSVWEELKGFWEKVQQQLREKNMFREHAEELRNTTDELFDKMKNLRKKLDEELRTRSKKLVDEFMEELGEIQKRIEGGLGLKPIFDDLKKLQHKLKDAAFTREHRKVVWQKIDQLFKDAKGKRSDDSRESSAGTSGYDRVKRRLDGLLHAMDKMQRSIDRDKKDLNFQNRRIEATDGQLEVQLRQAKLQMIEQRIASKEEKLKEMEKTKAFLEGKLQREAQKLERMKEQAEVEKVKEQVKDKIQEEIESNKEALKAQEESLLKAAEAIQESAKKGGKKEQPATGDKNNGPEAKESKEEEAKKEGANAGKDESSQEEGRLFEKIEEALEDSFEDMVDSVKAIASVVADRFEHMLDDIAEVGKKADTEKSEHAATEKETGGATDTGDNSKSN